MMQSKKNQILVFCQGLLGLGNVHEAHTYCETAVVEVGALS